MTQTNTKAMFQTDSSEEEGEVEVLLFDIHTTMHLSVAFLTKIHFALTQVMY